MPDMKLAYIVTNVGNGNKFLSDSMEFVPLLLAQQQTETNADGTYQSCNNATMPTEILMVGVGHHGRRPLLFIRTRTDVLIYQVRSFWRQDNTISVFKNLCLFSKVFKYSRGHLKIRFRKLNHNIIIPINDNPLLKRSDEMDVDGDSLQHNPQRIRSMRFFGKRALLFI